MPVPKNLVSDKHPLQSLLITIAFAGIGFILIGPGVGMIFAASLYSGDGDFLGALSTMQIDPAMFYPIMVMQACATGVGFILFPYLQLRYVEHKTLQPFFQPVRTLPLALLVVCVLGFNFIVGMSPIVEWNANLNFPEFLGGFEEWARAQEEQMKQFTEAVTNFESPAQLLTGILVIAVLAGVGEELVFRGLIQNEFWRGTRNIHVAIWVSALLFSAIHVQFYGFVPRMLLGALFGYLYYWSGNLLVPITGHVFNNGFGVILTYLEHQGMLDTNIEDNEAAPWPAVIGCAVVSALLLYYLWKFFQTQRTAGGEELEGNLN